MLHSTQCSRLKQRFAARGYSALIETNRYLYRLYLGIADAACLLRGHGRAGTQNDRLAEERGGHFEYRPFHTRAIDKPSAMPM